jgi:hypothetical protein
MGPGACVGGDGGYLIEGLEPGRYWVRFGFGCEDEPDRAPYEWFDDVPSRRCATPIKVIAGNDVEKIDAIVDRQHGASGPCPSRSSGATSRRLSVGAPIAEQARAEPTPDPAAARYDGQTRVDLAGRPRSRARSFALLLATIVGAAIMIGALIRFARERAPVALDPTPEPSADECTDDEADTAEAPSPL